MKNILLLILLLIPILCFSYDFDMGGIRNAALGGTGISSSEDASAAVWNPSLLGNINFLQLITDSRPYLMQMDNDEIYQNFTYFTFPIKKVPGAFAATGGLFNSKAYDEGKFGFHYGINLFPERLSGRLSTGISLYDNYLNYSEIDETKSAFDLDIGFAYKLNNKVQFGLVTKNITRANMAIEGSVEDRLPFILGIGSNAKWKRITFIGDLKFEKYSDMNEILFGLGFEYYLANNLLLRAGVNNNNITGGMGFRLFSKNWLNETDQPEKNMFNFSFLEIAIDYSFQIPVSASGEGDSFSIGNGIKSDFGDHFFGLKINFGKDKGTRDQLQDLFPSRFALDLDVHIDTVFVEKVRIDTLVREKTIYDTIRIIERIADSDEIQEKIEEEAKKIQKSDIANINKATVHLIDALKYYYSEEYIKAIEECEEAIYLAPALSLSYLRLASIYYRLGDIEEAMYQLNRAKRIDPNNPEIKKMMDMLSN